MPLALDFQLDVNGDLAIVDGDLAIVSDLPGIAQLARIALSTFLGEWFADESIGVDWFGQILGVKNPDLILARSLLRAALLAVPGISTVIDLDIVVNTDRTATITWTAATDLGLLTNQVTEVG